MKISASFLSSQDIPKDLRKLDATDVDYIHVDFMDGKFVLNKTMPYREMKHVSDYTSKRLDVHLMVAEPSKYIPLFAELNTEYITFHVEVEEDILANLQLIHSYSIKCGLAVKPDTKISSLVPYLPYLDLILIMSVEPGRGGQEFIPDTEAKIKEARALLDSYHVNAIINVDGGINNQVISSCRDADMVVAGSYVIKSDQFQEKISSLR
ncbi:MAG: ribulose-phosphate 3-epimerase [Bacilli bacterium]|nr:ribulose-phosphate 3-epimerase [Bacilli bacterium]